MMTIMALAVIIRLDSYQGLILNPSRYPALSLAVLGAGVGGGGRGSGVTLHRRARLVLRALRSQSAAEERESRRWTRTGRARGRGANAASRLLAFLFSCFVFFPSSDFYHPFLLCLGLSV